MEAQECLWVVVCSMGLLICSPGSLCKEDWLLGGVSYSFSSFHI